MRCVFVRRLQRVTIVIALSVTLVISVNLFLSFSANQTHVQKFLTDDWFNDCDHVNENLKVCDQEFAVLKNVLVRPKTPYSEDNRMPAPTFLLNCDSVPDSFFHGNNHLNFWKQNVICSRDVTSLISPDTNLTIMIQRYEYANIYHTMTDFYNAFLLMKILGYDQSKTSVLLWDYHPKGLLDSTWTVLFDQVLDIPQIGNGRQFSTLVWSILGYNSPLSAYKLPSIPYIEEFRNFFLSRHNINTLTRLDCKRLSILFLWRRNYVSHQGNPSGLIKRKILNEQQLLDSVQNLLPGHSVEGVQLDKLPMKDQVEIISKTDILIGMHGAGLTNALFLPNHAGLIELLPFSHFQSSIVSSFVHFESIARWRKLHYLSWRNPLKEEEFPGYLTRIDPNIVNNLVYKMKIQMCP